MLKVKGWFDDVLDAIGEVGDAIAGTVKGVKDAVFATAEEAYAFVASGVAKTKDAVKKLIDDIIADAVKNHPEAVAAVQAVADYIQALADKIKAFFNSPFFLAIKKVYDCYQLAQTIPPALKSVFTKIYEKVKTVISAVAMGPVGLAIIADIIVALLCAWDKFVKAADHIIKAVGETDPVKSFEQWGRGIGGILKVIASAETIKGAAGVKRRFK